MLSQRTFFLRRCNLQNLRSFARTKYLPRNLLTLSERSGLIHDTFPPETSQRLAQYLEEKPRTIYAGFDPTSDSLHIGNLLIIMGLLHAQRSGHQPIALIGGATAQIGDPSGKTSERPKMSLSEIKHNVSCLQKNLETVFANHEEFIWSESKMNEKTKLPSLKIVNNQDWYDSINLVNFMRDYGRHLRMNKLLSRESVKSRLTTTNADPDGGMSFTEFSYQIFQSYDWLHLSREFDCTIQIGGSDQMGNIVSGYELIQRFTGRSNRDFYGILLPLVTSESGEKFGKSDGAPVWLSQEKSSPFDFYQFFLRIPDSNVAKMLHLFTFMSLSQVSDLVKSHQREPEKRRAQTKLAEHLTILVHGRQGLELAQKTTNILYGQKDATQTLAVMTRNELTTVFAQSPYVRLQYTNGISVLQLAMKIGCFKSEKDAIKIIDGGGFYVNQSRHSNTDEIILPELHILPNQLTLVRVGKKNYYIVEWTL